MLSPYHFPDLSFFQDAFAFFRTDWQTDVWCPELPERDALVENEEGLTGVYVLSGKRVVFKPIKILYHADNHVMATAAIYYKSNGEIDEEKTPDLPVLEAYDRVIVKGKNLYDGKVINNVS